MSYNDGIINGISSFASDAQLKVTLIQECLVTIADNAESIQDTKANLATVYDAIKSAVDEAQEYIKEL